MTTPLRPKAVAARLGVHVETVRELIRSGQLVATRVTPRRFSVAPEDVDAYLAARRVVGQPKPAELAQGQA